LRGWQRGVSPAPVYPLRLRLRLRYLAGLFQGVRSILFVTPLDVAVDCSASKKPGVGCGRPTAAKILLSSTQNIRQQHPTEVFRPMYLKQVLSSSWDGPPFGHNRHGPEPSSIFVPTGILIHLAVWPQKTWAENCGVLCPFLGVSWIPSYTQCRLGRVLYLHAKSQLDPSNPFQNTPASQTGKTDNGPIG